MAQRKYRKFSVPLSAYDWFRHVYGRRSCREVFEEWVSGMDAFCPGWLWRDESGSYGDDDVEHWWHGWQGAWNHRP